VDSHPRWRACCGPCCRTWCVAPTMPPKESSTLLGGSEKEEKEEGALEDGGVVNIWQLNRIGYILQYFAVGLIYGGLPATQYGLFIAYLNTPAYISNAAAALATFPWSLKIVFAILTDCFPIMGYRRIPWMAGGWSLASIFLIALACLDMPEPYYCFGADGYYNTSEVCNEEASESMGFSLAMLMFMVALGYVTADVAADALTVTYARREPKAIRGRTQTTAYAIRQVGIITAQLLVGFGMNGKEYNGTFDNGMSFNLICGLLALPAIAMIPLSLFMIEEERCDGKPKGGTAQAKEDGGEGEGHIFTLAEYKVKAKMLLYSGAVCEVLCYQFLAGVVGGIGTTAGAEVMLYWAGVQNLQNQLFSIAGNLLFAVGLYWIQKSFLHVSWRAMIAITIVIMNLIDMPFTFCTIFDVVRNQYFFLDDFLILSIPSAMAFVVSAYVNVEMAEKGNEGLTYGLFSTANNLGGPVASVIANAVYGLFRPSLSDSANYIKDTQSFRREVAWSYVLSYFFSFASLLLLPLLPSQKDDAQKRKATRPSGRIFAIVTVGIVAAGTTYSLIISLLSVIPSTSCLPIAGGSGCEEGLEEEVLAANATVALSAIMRSGSRALSQVK